MWSVSTAETKWIILVVEKEASSRVEILMLVQVGPLVHVVNGHGVQGGRLSNKRRKRCQILMTEGVGSSKDYAAPNNVGCNISSRPL